MPGRYFDELHKGERLVHKTGRTLTEADNVFFCAITMNTQPLHLDEHFAKQTPFGRRIVNGILTMGLAVGLTVSELTEGTIVANLGYEQVRHPHPMFHGDSLYVESEVLETRPSKSRADCGLVKLRHVGRNQDGVIVIELERTVLFKKRPATGDVA